MTSPHRPRFPINDPIFQNLFPQREPLDCKHILRRVYEQQADLLTLKQLGWECCLCRAQVRQDQLTPLGVGGQQMMVSESMRVVGLDGGPFVAPDGSLHVEKVVNEGKDSWGREETFN